MKTIRIAAVACGLSAILWGQQFKFNLDHLAAKASDVVDVSLNKDMLQFAGRFLSSKDPDEAKAKAMLNGLEGLYIKRFEFKTDGAWSAADLDQVRVQLKAPEWTRIVNVKSDDEDNVEIWVRNESGKVTGVAVLAAGRRELTVGNLVGNVDLASLADLGGQFGLPKLRSVPKKKEP
jgi:hypothetical protein